MKRVASFVGVVVAVAGFVAFVGLIYGAWWAKREADRQVTDAVGKANSAIDVAGKAVNLVKDVLSRAEADVENARANATSAPAPANDPFMRLMVAQANRQLPGDMERARDAVAIASETAVVAQSAIDVFDERSDAQAALGIHPEQMKTARDHLDKATTDLRQAQSVLGLPINHPDARLTDDQYQAVRQALDQGKGITEKLDGAIDNARTRVATAQRKAEFWSLRLAVAATVLGGVGALGQVFMLRACVRGLREPSHAA
jgi:hypothetical protein